MAVAQGAHHLGRDQQAQEAAQACYRPFLRHRLDPCCRLLLRSSPSRRWRTKEREGRLEEEEIGLTCGTHVGPTFHVSQN